MAPSALTRRCGARRVVPTLILTMTALTALTVQALPASAALAQVRAAAYDRPAAPPSPARTARTASAALRPAAAQVKAGANLLLNPDATAGDTSAQGWDAVTIPGWQVQAGLPTVVRYGTPGFPRLPAAKRWPAAGGRLFAGGAGGTASLVQVVPFGHVTKGARFTVGAWLGGTKSSAAALKVRFLDASGRVLSTVTLGPAGDQARAPLSHRTATGAVPDGAAAARVTLLLGTTLTNDNGPDAPQTGYDDAAAGGLRLALNRPVASRPLLTRPSPRVPRYQHVFLFYFENQDFGQVIGNTRQAPYLNSLTGKGALLTGFYAEEHPSDGNYLAFAGGSAFGVPLDDPAEENPLYTIDAKNIGDLITAKGETWKSYTQSASGPCDDTVHGYYWNDDQPMLYFRDVRDRPAYCASHVVPLEELPGDLSSAATTPSFSWIAPDDCSDMEGCGIAAGDQFLKAQLTRIMNSPAWRTQRSLAIITFDEDAQDYQHPAQRVPTIVLATQGVPHGITDPTRYTHYGMLRTVEAALGLGTLTANDRYATAFNQIFTPERVPASAPSAAVTVSGAGAVSPAPAASAARLPAAALLAAAAAARQPVAWVANYGDDTVSPVNLVTRRAGTAIPAGPGPRAIAAAPDGRTVYVADSGSDTVTPIDTRTGKPGPPIRAGASPWALAITPDGKTLYVADGGSGTVTPVALSPLGGQHPRPGRPIRTGRDPRAIALTPDGKTAYVLNWLSGTVTPIATASDRPGRPIRVGAFPSAYAFSPGGRTLFVASFGANSVTPIAVATGRAGRPQAAGQAPDALAVAGARVYAVDGDSDAVTRLGGKPVRVGYSPAAIAVRGASAYIVNTIDSTVSVLDTRTGKVGRTIAAGAYTYPTAIALSGATAIVVEPYGYSVTLIDTTTSHAYPPITVGAYPTAVAVTGD